MLCFTVILCYSSCQRDSYQTWVCTHLSYYLSSCNNKAIGADLTLQNPHSFIKGCQVHRQDLYCTWTQCNVCTDTQKRVCFTLWLSPCMCMQFMSECVFVYECVFGVFYDRWASSRHNEGHTPPTLPSCFVSALRGTNTTVMTQAVTARWACVCASVRACVHACVRVTVLVIFSQENASSQRQFPPPPLWNDNFV